MEMGQRNNERFLRGRCFIIKPSQLSKGDKKPDEVIFHSESAVVNEIILELCQGNHHLFFQVSIFKGSLL